jgi:hypothetical protein
VGFSLGVRDASGAFWLAVGFSVGVCEGSGAFCVAAGSSLGVFSHEATAIAAAITAVVTANLFLIAVFLSKDRMREPTHTFSKAE